MLTASPAQDTSAPKPQAPLPQRPSPALGAQPVPAQRLVDDRRLAAVEQRLLVIIQWVVFSAVFVLTMGAGALSWEHLTHIAATNGHIAPRHLLFLFPSIVDGFMVASSAVVVRHALTDELGKRTWYAGGLVAATASLSICLNIQDSTGHQLLPAWALPGIAPTLYMLGTELGLAELRLLMRRLRQGGQTSATSAANAPEAAIPTKKETVLATLAETSGRVPAALGLLAERGVKVDRSYVYEIRRSLDRSRKA